MKFLLDENMDRRLTSFLESLGHDVTAVSVEYPHGLPDHEVLALARLEQRILITNDVEDFGELVFQRYLPHAGIILFRFKTEQSNIQLRKERLHYVLTRYPDQLQHFIVITPQRIKIRKTITEEDLQ
jgi:predicted nuclease of predicted toxin-antitoxin system